MSDNASMATAKPVSVKEKIDKDNLDKQAILKRIAELQSLLHDTASQTSGESSKADQQNAALQSTAAVAPKGMKRSLSPSTDSDDDWYVARERRIGVLPCGCLAEIGCECNQCVCMCGCELCLTGDSLQEYLLEQSLKDVSPPELAAGAAEHAVVGCVSDVSPPQKPLWLRFYDEIMLRRSCMESDEPSGDTSKTAC